MSAAEAAFERAKADAASAVAAVSETQAAVQAKETDLSKAVIRSPINGVVLTRNIEPGQTVAASLQAPVLFTLAEDLAKMELHVNIDEADVGKVKEGQKATFSVSAYPNRTFSAQITQARFGSSTTSGVVTYETVLKVDNRDLSLRPGMTATADIIVQQSKMPFWFPMRRCALHRLFRRQRPRPEEVFFPSLYRGRLSQNRAQMAWTRIRNNKRYGRFMTETRASRHDWRKQRHSDRSIRRNVRCISYRRKQRHF